MDKGVSFGLTTRGIVCRRINVKFDLVAARFVVPRDPSIESVNSARHVN